MMRNAKESITTEKREEKIRSAKEIIDSRAELAPSMCATRFIRQILFAMNIPGYSSAQNRSSGDEIGFEGIWTGHEYRAANAVITRQLTDKFYNKIAEELIVPESEWIENYASFIFDSSGNRVYKIKQPLATRVYGGYIKNAFNITPFIKRGEVKP